MKGLNHAPLLTQSKQKSKVWSFTKALIVLLLYCIVYCITKHFFVCVERLYNITKGWFWDTPSPRVALERSMSSYCIVFTSSLFLAALRWLILYTRGSTCSTNLKQPIPQKQLFRITSTISVEAHVDRFTKKIVSVRYLFDCGGWQYGECCQC